MLIFFHGFYYHNIKFQMKKSFYCQFGQGISILKLSSYFNWDYETIMDIKTNKGRIWAILNIKFLFLENFIISVNSSANELLEMHLLKLYLYFLRAVFIVVYCEVNFNKLLQVALESLEGDDVEVLVAEMNKVCNGEFEDYWECIDSQFHCFKLSITRICLKRWTTLNICLTLLTSDWHSTEQDDLCQICLT